MPDSVDSDELPHKWVEALNGDVPEGAIEGGHDDKNQKLYVGRGYYKNVLIPGSLSPADGCVHVCLEGNVAKLTAYEVLCETQVTWKEGSRGNRNIPQRSCVGWLTEETAFICGRVKIKDWLVPGMYSCDTEFFYAVHQGKEMAFNKFEILVFDK